MRMRDGTTRTDEGAVMLDAVVRIEVGEVERICFVVAPEHVRGVVDREVGEGGREVVRRARGRVKLRELDIPAVMREDACAEAERLSVSAHDCVKGWRAGANRDLRGR